MSNVDRLVGVKLWDASAIILAVTAGVAISACAALQTARPRVSKPAAAPSRPTGADLRTADLKDVDVPGVVCDLPGPVHLRDGAAHLEDPRGWPDHSVRGKKFINITEWKTRYGSFEGPATSDAVVSLICDNNGGTADGQIKFTLAVYSGRSGSPRLLGLITPQVQPQHEHTTLLSVEPAFLKLGRHKIAVKEAFYGPHDGTCCPTGRALTTWTYDGQQLTPAPPRVLRHPRHHW